MFGELKGMVSSSSITSNSLMITGLAEVTSISDGIVPQGLWWAWSTEDLHTTCPLEPEDLHKTSPPGARLL